VDRTFCKASVFVKDSNLTASSFTGIHKEPFLFVLLSLWMLKENPLSVCVASAMWLLTFFIYWFIRLKLDVHTLRDTLINGFDLASSGILFTFLCAAKFSIQWSNTRAYDLALDLSKYYIIYWSNALKLRPNVSEIGCKIKIVQHPLLLGTINIFINTGGL
jgi:hypothetical protein